MDFSDRMEAEGLANSREMVQMILRDWDWLTWDTLLADNVALSLNLGAAAVTWPATSLQLAGISKLPAVMELSAFCRTSMAIFEAGFW